MGNAASNEFERVNITEDNQETVQEYFKVKDRIERYVKPEHRIQIDIQSIERIRNPVLDTRLHNVMKQLHKKDCKPELLIHGTTRDSAESIIKEGFKVGQCGMFGSGIYFATDSTKSAQYCRDDGLKYLLLCDVALGRTMVCTSAYEFLNLDYVTQSGHDSVYAKRQTKGGGGVLNDEYIVYRAEQAAPRYLVKFHGTKMPRLLDKAVQCGIGNVPMILRYIGLLSFIAVIIFAVIAFHFLLPNELLNAR